MLWIDIETTGLDPHKDVILEVALALTEWDGLTISTCSSVIYEETMAYHSALSLGRRNSIVNEMHKKSGLWDELETGISRDKFTDNVYEWLTNWNVPVGTLPMCGSSIGALDRPMLYHQMNRLYQCFNYRSIDVSSIKESCRRCNPSIYEALPKSDSNKGHRALDDIFDSITEYQFYMDEYLIVDAV